MVNQLKISHFLGNAIIVINEIQVKPKNHLKSNPVSITALSHLFKQEEKNHLERRLIEGL